MYGIVKFFNPKKGFGFIGTNEGKDYFFHVSGLKDYDGRPNADDSVEFDVSKPNKDGSVCAYNVKPILTLDMVRKALGKDHLHLKSKKNAYGNRVWLVLDDNNVIHASEKGLSLEEVAEFAGFTIERE